MAACGGGSSDDRQEQGNRLRGTAAIGAAVQGATVIAKCADGSGFVTEVKTDSKGAWTGEVASGAFPCALQLRNGSPAVKLHSYAFEAGVANLTPLTDLALAGALGEVPSAWFGGASPSVSSGDLRDGVSELRSALEAGGYELPSGPFEPFVTPFAVGDAWDRLLDALQAAIDGDEELDGYEALLARFAEGDLSSLPGAPEAAGGTGGVGGVGGGSGGAPADDDDGNGGGSAGAGDGPPPGTGAGLDGADGATGTWNGTTYTFVRNESSVIPNVGWVAGNISGTVFHFEAYEPQGDSFNSLTSWRINGVPPEVGAHPCRTTNDTLPIVRLTLNGQVRDASSCTVEILAVGGASVTGRFSAVIDGLPVDDGYFHSSL